MLVVLAATVALANDPSGWEAVNRRGTSVGTLGVAMFGLGVPTELLGVGLLAATTEIDFSDYRSPVEFDPTWSKAGVAVALGGWSALKIGPALTAGGALRARRALVELGEPVPSGAGYAAWGMLGGSLACTGVFLVTGDLVAMVGSTALLVGSFAAGAGQLGVNGAAWRRLHPELVDVAPRRRVQVALAPRIGRDGGGLSLVGAW